MLLKIVTFCVCGRQNIVVLRVPEEFVLLFFVVFYIVHYECDLVRRRKRHSIIILSFGSVSYPSVLSLVCRMFT
jgi:hypothetical protein